ncbi:MAG: DNA repair protein RadC [Treponemataceae bacterium]|nr:DNA repair protein RadC [Treponemataceae bacterium]
MERHRTKKKSPAIVKEGSGESYEKKLPREKIFTHGVTSLSDEELLAVMLHTGIQGKPVITLSREVLTILRQHQGLPRPEDFTEIPGLGLAKICTILAMLEYGRRQWGPLGQQVHGPDDAYQLVRPYASRKQEHFVEISLNGAHEVLAVRLLTVGLVNKTMIHPREVFAEPIKERACGVIVAHNHPSGRLEPSEEDKSITRRLKDAAEILGIPLLDHLIFSETHYISFTQQGWL